MIGIADAGDAFPEQFAMIASPRPAKFPARRGKSRRRVLIVDEEPLIRWSLVSALYGAGFDARAAASGAEALAFARTDPPDVLLIDTTLYDMDPATVIHGVRAAASDCRVLALTTGHPRPGSRLPRRVVTIRKPFDLSEVVRIVEAQAGTA